MLIIHWPERHLEDRQANRQKIKGDKKHPSLALSNKNHTFSSITRASMTSLRVVMAAMEAVKKY